MPEQTKATLIEQAMSILKVQGVAVVTVIALLYFMYVDEKQDAKVAEILERAFIRQQDTVSSVLKRVDGGSLLQQQPNFDDENDR